MHQIENLESRYLLSGLTSSVIARGLNSPTALDVLPDGRVLITEQAGVLRIIRNGALATSSALQIAVDNAGERGLLGVAHDPNFNSNHFIYLYHTVKAVGNSAAHNEVTRYTLNGNGVVAGSSLDILRITDLSPARQYHNGGAIHFGSDGMLYVGVGDNGEAANSQVLYNLLGKVLRIDVSHSATGDLINAAKIIPLDNPFFASASGINAAIYALGFRNPFTFAVNPNNGQIFINDVGLNSWEEINRLQAGGNYGWGIAEGFTSINPPTNLGPGSYQDPILAYPHNNGGHAAIASGAFYNAVNGVSAFPDFFNGKYFFADFSRSFIRIFDPLTPGSLVSPDSSTAFIPSTISNPVDLAAAPDGGLYYIANTAGQLVKIYTDNNSPPVIATQPRSAAAIAGNTITFSVAANGTATLRYQWQRDVGGGNFVDIEGATNSSYVTPTVGSDLVVAPVRVLVSNDFGSAISDTARGILPTPPKLKLSSVVGLRKGKFNAGSPITVFTTASDKYEGLITPTYEVDYITNSKSSANSVTTPIVTGTGSVFSFTPLATDSFKGTDVRYRVIVNATNSAGRTTTVIKDLLPNVVKLKIQSSPVSGSIGIDAAPSIGKKQISSIVGFVHHLVASDTASNGSATYNFGSWSDGGLLEHDINTPSRDATITARYLPGT